MPANLLNSVRSYLASQHMLVVDDWLTGCVEYLTEDTSNNYSESEIQTLAKEQWLLNDLKDICPGSLPANLKSQPKTVLNGRFTLQINAAIDIGTPAYQQYLKLQKINTENIEATTKFDDKIPSHRMIKLYLTDGVQEVSGIEYQPMRNLSCEITPGCKVLIKGPVECRRGVMLLKESSLELLGGEVQEMALSHSLAGLLHTKLGVNVNIIEAVSNTRNTDIPAPHSTMPSRVDTSESSTRLDTNSQLNAQTRQDITQPTNDYSRLTTSHNRSLNDHTRPIARVTSVQVASITDDDIDIDQIAEIEAQHNPTSSKRSLPDSASKPDKKFKIDNGNTEDDYPTDTDLLFEDDEHMKDMEAYFDAKEGLPTQKYPEIVSPKPYVFIKQLNELTESNTGKVFRVRGQIMKLLSKLSVGKDGWSLKCTIVDGTGNIDVEFTSGVLSKLVGYTPQEMNQLKKQIATKPELKAMAVSALQKARDALQVLNCIIELTMLDVPKITNLIPIDQTIIDYLKVRTHFIS